MIGLVVVSHSRALAEAAVALAAQMVPGRTPRIAIAAGLDDGSFGTDAAAIALAIGTVDGPGGVLVLLDLGSALLSSELAVEFLDDEVAQRVRISPAPLVEGLLSAVVQAATGASLDEVDAEARNALLAKTAHLDDADEQPELPQLPRAAKTPTSSRAVVWRTTVRSPHGIHVRPAAAIVAELRGLDAEVLLSNASTGRGPAAANSLSRITGLELRRGQVMEARFSGPQADQARAALADLAARDYGENLVSTPRPAPRTTKPLKPPAPAAERRAVIGPVNHAAGRPATQSYRPAAPKDELARFTRAAAQVSEFLAELAASGQGVPGILEAQQAMLADRELHHGVVSHITEGFSAVEAVDQHLTELGNTFDEFTDPYLRERGQDLRGLRRLLQLALLGLPLVEQAPDVPMIWLLEELDAATATRLDPDICLGVITLSGGASGHGMLTAQARGIPVLPGCREAATLTHGQRIAFDPITAELWPHPDDELRAELAARNRERREIAELAQARAHEPAATPSGVRVRVSANIGSLADASIAAAEGAEGSGVVRTEVLFADCTEPPTAAQQAEVLVRLGRTLSDRLTVRAWDPGADKPMAFLPQAIEENPALGERGMRAMQRHPEIFDEQLRALILASAEVEVRLLLPMVTEVAEVRWAAERLAAVAGELGADPVPLGMMVEVPAAALRVADFAELVDFVSIGTNDLTQYTQAADRANSSVAKLARQDAPAVLDLIKMTCEQVPQLPVSVCGDLASDPGFTAQLVAMGVRELSVRPQMVAEIKQAVRQG